MRFPVLITTDVHLVESPAAEYRWELFPWINQQIKEHGVKSVRILGDITDAKDNHSAALVNRVVAGIKSIECDDVKVLAGNHDWLKQGEEFFRFLNHIPGVEFITKPTEEQAYGKEALNCLYLPYSKNPSRDWANFDFSHYDYVFIHQTISGAIASNGEAMDGEPLPDLSAAGRVYSGDIHVPQRIKGVTYIGSPYHVHFGDDFKPRVLLLGRRGDETWLHMPSPRRVVVKVRHLRELRRVELQPGDQVKLRMVLKEEDKHSWARLKREAVTILEERGVVVHGTELSLDREAARWNPDELASTAYTPEELVKRYVETEELGGDAFEIAMEVISS